jgi:pimeloyl-ACP methyl ester carboxylesterase
VVRYDLRDCGASTTLDPEAPGYHLRDLAADAAALVGTLGAVTAHLGGVGVGGMVAQVAAAPSRSTPAGPPVAATTFASRASGGPPR